MDLRDPQTQTALLGTILVLGLGYAFYQYLYTPKRERVAELHTQAERLESYNEAAKRAARENRIGELEEESVSYARRLEAFEELIPTAEHVPQLLERVAIVALETDVDLLSFTPLPAEPGTFYTEQFYEVEVRGGYHEIGNFLTRVATLPRIIKPAISELLGEQVEPPARGRAADPSAPPPKPETVVRAKLQLSTYVVPGGEALTVGGDTAAVRPLAPALGSVQPPAAALGAEARPPPVPSVAPPVLADRLSPGVAPALEAERQRAAAQAAAQATDASGAPGATAAPPSAEVAEASPAPAPTLGLGAAAAQAEPAPAPPPPAPVTVETAPAAPQRPPVGELLPPGERASGPGTAPLPDAPTAPGENGAS